MFNGKRYEEKVITKIRIVFDASAHSPEHLPLNELLYSYENLLSELLRVLLNFRGGCIGIIADIEKAFLHISFQENERDIQSFMV